MAQDAGGGVMQQGGTDHFAQVNFGTVYATSGEHLAADDAVAGVEPENMELFVRQAAQPLSVGSWKLLWGH